MAINIESDSEERALARVSKDGHKRERAGGHPSRRRFAPPQDEVCGLNSIRPIRLVSWNRSTIREMPPVFGAFALIGGSCPIQVRADVRDGYDLIAP